MNFIGLIMFRFAVVIFLTSVIVAGCSSSSQRDMSQEQVFICGHTVYAEWQNEQQEYVLETAKTH